MWTAEETERYNLQSLEEDPIDRRLCPEDREPSMIAVTRLSDLLGDLSDLHKFPRLVSAESLGNWEGGRVPTESIEQTLSSRTP